MCRPFGSEYFGLAMRHHLSHQARQGLQAMLLVIIVGVHADMRRHDPRQAGLDCRSFACTGFVVIGDYVTPAMDLAGDMGHIPGREADHYFRLAVESTKRSTNAQAGRITFTKPMLRTAT